MYSIEVCNFSKTYRKHFWTKLLFAVNNCNFSVRKNKITGFVGPNGAGKTTTIKSIMGLVQPTSGKLKLNGCDTQHPSARKSVAYLSEQPYFYPHLTVWESLELIAHLLSLPSKDISNEISRVLTIVELNGKEHIKVKEMSKGMQQRLNMAQAMLGNPELMILDEPMSGMDPPGRRLFRTLFKQLSDNGATIFFSTHVLEDIEAVCDEVVVLSKGCVTYTGEVATILSNGLLGTDIFISSLPEILAKKIGEIGCEYKTTADGKIQIFVPKDKNSLDIQKLLYAENIYPEKISSRRMNLEDLLYGRENSV
jgi:ABC-2 type transport system ATP-binding protein